MSKVLKHIGTLPHVMAVDDERNIGNYIIVTLKNNWFFVVDPGCGIRGFETVNEAKANTGKKSVYFVEPKTQ